MVLIYKGVRQPKKAYSGDDDATYQFASGQTLCVAKPLHIARDRLAEKAKHLPHRKRHAHTVITVRVTSDQTPQLPKRDDRLA